jgi:hypothetical protein
MALVVAGTDFIQMPAGTTAQRPPSPAAGMIRFNTTTGFSELYNGTIWARITSGAYPNPTSTVEYLVVAGGGGGGGAPGGNQNAGGGGAGGMLTGSGLSVTAGTTYTVTVGAGGAGGTAVYPSVVANRGSNGSNSVFNGITSLGGGGGARIDEKPPTGGSGGGGAANGAGGDGTAGQGNNGAAGLGYNQNGSGGGGKGAAGSGNTGGSGSASSITGSSVTYAAGGNGSTSVAGTNGAANTGNGATGGKGANGGVGGSGVVIIKYSSSFDAATVTGDVTSTVTGGFRIYQFNSSGSILFPG